MNQGGKKQSGRLPEGVKARVGQPWRLGIAMKQAELTKLHLCAHLHFPKFMGRRIKVLLRTSGEVFSCSSSGSIQRPYLGR